MPLLSAFFSNNNVYGDLRRNCAKLTETIKKGFKEIRTKAVEALKREPYFMVEPVMAQLCQALRYEDLQLKEKVEGGLTTYTPISGENPDLLEFLLDKCCEDSPTAKSTAQAVHWHLYLEKENEENGEKDPAI